MNSVVVVGAGVGGPDDGDRSANAQKQAELYQRRSTTDVTQDT
jgi:hypothetical protein